MTDTRTLEEAERIWQEWLHCCPCPDKQNHTCDGLSQEEVYEYLNPILRYYPWLLEHAQSQEESCPSN